jgi:predicted AAA+ superfamily ATPase
MDKEIIKRVIADNQEEVSNFQIVERDFNFEEFGNYVFVGIRRAGKSFLLYQRIQQLLHSKTNWNEMLYINFEDERLSGMQREDLNLLLEIHWEMYGKKPILFLDEIQNIAGWEKFARRLADSKYRVYITGSNAKMLGSDIQTTLGGRYITIDVYPYAFTEFLKANNIPYTEKVLLGTRSRAEIFRKFSDYFRFGGFPEGALLAAKRDYLTSIYQKIFLGDIATRHGIENIFALRLLIKKLAESVKTPVSYSRLANIVSSAGAKVGTNTVINYVDYAKDAWLVTPVQNIASKLVDKETNPKYYFTDNGLLNLFLLDGNTALLENLVAVTLLRQYGREDAVFFYNKNIEVDFYIPETGTAIQVCYNPNNAESTFDREVNALLKITKVLDCNKLLIITYETEEKMEINNTEIEVIPVWKWLLKI